MVALKEMNAYFSLLTADQKKSVLSLIKSFLKPEEAERISVEQYNKELDEAERKVSEGDSLTDEEAREILSKW